jgi:hypothetical protein
LDNSGKDNKNQTVMAFCSELVSRGVFETVQMSFLMVGHTHEDVDALFSKVSKQVRNKEVATLPALMAEVWECESIHPVPRVIQEVASYKSYLQTFNVKEIEGHSKPVAFLFSMRDNVPIYQYKSHVKHPWMPPTGRCIWYTIPNTNTLSIPSGQPFAKPIMEVHKKLDEIIPFLNRYMEFLRKICIDETSNAYLERMPLVKYWEKIVKILSTKLTVPEEGLRDFPLKYDFWPKTNHDTGYKILNHINPEEGVLSAFNAEMIGLQNEYNDEIEDQAAPFVGTRSEREPYRWVPLQDIQEGHFVFLRPENEWETQNGKGRFWLVRALGPVTSHTLEDTTSEMVPMFPMQWWRPKHIRHNITEAIRYEDCFKPNKTWERDPSFLEGSTHWQTAGSAMYGYKSKTKEENFAKGLKIPKNILSIVQEYMQNVFG